MVLGCWWFLEKGLGWVGTNLCGSSQPSSTSTPQSAEHCNEGKRGPSSPTRLSCLP